MVNKNKEHSIQVEIVGLGNRVVVKAILLKDGCFYEQFGVASGVLDATDLAIKRVIQVSKLE